jgi:isopenicillin N synthase-like dioxygenase
MTQLHRIDPQMNIGYAPFGSKNLNHARPHAELKEAFNIRFPPSHTNDLSNCPSSFIDLVPQLQDQLQVAAIRYAYACALALDLPQQDYFANTLNEFDSCTIRFLHYPPCDYTVSPASAGDSYDYPLRISEHTDFGAYTFLLLGDHGAEGLQIKPVEGGELDIANTDELGGWQDVVLPLPKPNDEVGAIVNTGALMARWTNDEWRATAHRVIVNSEQVAARHRYSIAFFVDPHQ